MESNPRDQLGRAGILPLNYTRKGTTKAVLPFSLLPDFFGEGMPVLFSNR